MKLLDKALLQVIIGAGIIIEDRLRPVYTDLCNDINDVDGINTEFADIFKRINESLKDFQFEIRTVVARDDNNRPVYYHGKSCLKSDIRL